MLELCTFLYELSMETLWQDKAGWYHLPPGLTGIPRDRESERRVYSNSKMTVTRVDWVKRRVTVTCS